MQIVIDGKTCDAKRGEFLLDIAKRNGIDIPTLCHLDALPGEGNCRMCIVEVLERGRSRVVTSCIYPVKRPVEVLTNTPKIIKMRKTLVMLLASRVPENDMIYQLCEQYDVKPPMRFTKDPTEECILCRLCVRACEEIKLNAISTVNRGITKKISTPFDEPSDTCIGCGACAYVCPTNAIKIHDKNGKRYMWNKSFELLKCEKCGEYFTTRENFEYVNKQLECKEPKILCDKCKKTQAQENLRDIFSTYEM
ncbi:MAG TPA: 2Fe-2S iron-sulfur cluster binding domain-containing protein [Thermoanaerobacterales bacterium]|nr:2Fe-2S iron-sulfur cluster binding domain-containing protein [Thermoanaerobacterales bacterium]